MIPEDNLSLVGKRIVMMARHHQNNMARKLEPYGVGHGQYPMLLEVFRCPGIVQEQLAAHMRINKSSVARAIAQLEHAGLLERRVNPADRRSYCLYPTTEGGRIVPILKQASRESVEEMIQGFAPEEVILLRDLLERMMGNIAEHLVEKRGISNESES